MSVNDSFVMNTWAQDQKLENVKVIPDGNGQFTGDGNVVRKEISVLVKIMEICMIVNNGIVEKMFVEPGKTDDTPEDPYGESSPENVLKYLQENK